MVDEKPKSSNRRVMKRNKKSKNENKKLKMVGLNCAGLSSKLHSFDNMLIDIQPGAFFLEETKMKRIGSIKTENSDKYQIFELVRKQSAGGGLVFGALHSLNPTWLGEGDDEVEWLSVEISPAGLKIRCVVGYGPQEGDRDDRKKKFWDRLEIEAAAAQNQNTGLIIQIDGNLWAGPELVPGDPHPQE